MNTEPTNTTPTSQRRWCIVPQRDLYEGSGLGGETRFEECPLEEAETFAIMDDDGKPANFDDPDWYVVHDEPTLEAAIGWAAAHGYSQEYFQADDAAA